MPNMPLTNKQQAVYSFIAEHIDIFGWAPTTKEIAERFKVSWQTAKEYLDVLVRKEYIKREPNKWRSIKII